MTDLGPGVVAVARVVVLALVMALGSGCGAFHTDSRPSCPTDRTIAIGLQDDVVGFAGCKRASGVTIRTGATIDLGPLRELETIDGDLVIGPTVGLDEASFNSLVAVGGAVRVASNGSLRGLFLPRLERAGRVVIDGNVELATIAMPRLMTVAAALVVTDNHDLELLDAGSLATVGSELVVSGHPKLALVELGRLSRAQTVQVDGNPKLSPELVDQLRAKAAPP